MTDSAACADLEVLAARAREGGREAVEALLRRCQPDLRRFARTVCRTGEDAEDAVQHALFVVSSRLGAFRAAAKFTTWIFTIIRNECWRYMRRAAHLVVGGAERTRGTSRSPEDELGERELLERLSEAIAAMSGIYRDVFLLREIEGLSTAEVARRLALSDAAVKVRLHRARAIVRQVVLGSEGRPGVRSVPAPPEDLRL